MGLCVRLYRVVQNCSNNCFANFCKKLLGNDVRLFRFPQSWLHLRPPSYARLNTLKTYTMREDNLCQHSSASGSLKIVQNCSDNCFADFCRKLLGNDVRLFQVHLRERLKSETANHEMIAKPTIVLPIKIFILLCEKQLIYHDGYCKN